MALRPRNPLTDMAAIYDLIESSKLGRNRANVAERNAMMEFLNNERAAERSAPGFRNQLMREVRQAEQDRKSRMSPEDLLRELVMSKKSEMDNASMASPGVGLYSNPNDPAYAPGMPVDTTNRAGSRNQMPVRSSRKAKPKANTVTQARVLGPKSKPTPTPDATHPTRQELESGAIEQGIDGYSDAPKERDNFVELDPTPRVSPNTEKKKKALQPKRGRLNPSQINPNAFKAGMVDWSRLGVMGVKSLNDAAAATRGFRFSGLK